MISAQQFSTGVLTSLFYKVKDDIYILKLKGWTGKRTLNNAKLDVLTENYNGFESVRSIIFSDLVKRKRKEETSLKSTSSYII